MFKNYLITAWRNIIKNGMFSAINIFGLALGLMSCILIMLFVRQETGYEQFLPNSDKIVRMHSAYYTPNRPPFLTVRSAGSMMPAVRDYAKNEVEAGARLIRFGASVRKDEDAFPEQINLVEDSFFEVFDLPFAYGSKETSFTKPYDLVVSEELAIKYFGRTDVLGETMTICCVRGEVITLPIAGVIKDLPEATHLDLDMIVQFNPNMFSEPGTLDTWTSVNVYTYFKLTESATVEQLQERLSYWVNNESPFIDMFANNMGGIPEGKQLSDMIQHRLMAIPDIHLKARKDAGNMGDFKALGDEKLIYTFTLVAALILIIACINFINLATARASQRAKEVAMRKVLGATRTQVAVQFLAEAVTLVFISLMFAVMLVELLLPLYNEAIGAELQLHLFTDKDLLVGFLAVVLIVGLGAGLYPALFLSRFLPGHILKSNKSTDTGGSSKLRTALVVFQFATSISLVVCTAVIYGQTMYSQSMDVGFVSEDKLVLNIRPAGENLESLRQELLNLPQISSVVLSSEAPTQDNENNTVFTLLSAEQGGEPNQQELLNYHNMGYGFFEAYDVKPLAGRLFNEDYGTDTLVAMEEGSESTGRANIILNESAARKYGFDDPQQSIGKTVEANVFRAGTYHLEIVGVIPDIYFRSLKFGIRPTVYMLNPSRFSVASLTFKTNDIGGLLADVERIWKKSAPMQPIDLQFLSEMMEAQYMDEIVQARLFLVFSVLAIVVACLGLYGLAAFTTERRTKEIGIRKVMGANVADIVKLLIWQFSKPVILANVIAWPVSIYAMLIWLESFPYRINQLWLFPICFAVGFTLMIIAWLTVGGNAAKVASSNPINALRQE